MNKHCKSAARRVKQYNCRNTESVTEQFILGKTNDTNGQKVNFSAHVIIVTTPDYLKKRAGAYRTFPGA